ncbi:MAG: cyclic nucleotide-binding domain-containing protein [Comamonas sp.]|jgi:CRP-like cAMP-binding protein|nr:cyclic nucleotide-binding domain-containing protein [Comamonas sp.]
MAGMAGWAIAPRLPDVSIRARPVPKIHMLEALPTHFEYLGNAQDYAADIHEIFSSAPLFEPLDLAETTLLCNFMAVYSAHKNTTLLHQDESPAYMIILLTGAAKALRTMPDGKHTWLHDLEPGDTFGELAMLDNQPLRATCVSTKPVDFVVLSRDAFRDVLLTLPRLGSKLLMLFLRVASERLQLTEAWLPASD